MLREDTLIVYRKQKTELKGSFSQEVSLGSVVFLVLIRIFTSDLKKGAENTLQQMQLKKEKLFKLQKVLSSPKQTG